MLFVCQRQFLLFSTLVFFCLYNMINVYVYIVVRSKRKYIEKWSMYRTTFNENWSREWFRPKWEKKRTDEKKYRKEFFPVQCRMPNFLSDTLQTHRHMYTRYVCRDDENIQVGRETYRRKMHIPFEREMNGRLWND